jgi:hypothetical protein
MVPVSHNQTASIAVFQMAVGIYIGSDFSLNGLC